MVEKDPVLLDIGELIRIEKKLRRADVCAARPFVAHIQIRGEATLVIVCREFASVNLAALVIERGKDKRLAELAFVQDRMRAFIETIDAHIETFSDFLRCTGIKVISTL